MRITTPNGLFASAGSATSAGAITSTASTAAARSSNSYRMDREIVGAIPRYETQRTRGSCDFALKRYFRIFTSPAVEMWWDRYRGSFAAIRLNFLNPFEPDFAPIRVRGAWAKNIPRMVATHALHIFENDRRGFHGDHGAVVFIEQLGDALLHAIPLSAEWQHLCTENHSAVAVFSVERLHDFFARLHFDELTGLQIRGFRSEWSFLPGP